MCRIPSSVISKEDDSRQMNVCRGSANWAGRSWQATHQAAMESMSGQDAGERVPGSFSHSPHVPGGPGDVDKRRLLVLPQKTISQRTSVIPGRAVSPRKGGSVDPLK